MARRNRNRRRILAEALEERYLLSGTTADAWESAYVDGGRLGSTDGSTLPQPQPRIVGGVESEPGRWPAMVSVQVDSEHACGGTLVSPNVVVTAAHCIIDFFDQPIAPQRITAVVGRHALSSTNGETLGVSAAVAHPDFDSFTLDSDIAVLLLDANSTHPPLGYVRPEQEDLFAPGVLATIAGWGQRSEFGSTPDQLHEAQVPIVSNAIANAPISYDGAVTENMLAAGFAEGGADSCFGDSGGPLMVPSENTHLLAGVVSWGFGCGQPNFYGIYTRVANFAGWIDTFVGRADDPFEPNNALPQAFDLVTGDQTHSSLFIHHADSEDWYLWTSPADGELNIALALQNTAGDIDLQVYDGSGKFLAQSISTTNQESVRVPATRGDSFYIRVFGVRGIGHSEYSLTIDGPGDIPPDLFEPNDTLQQAVDVFFFPVDGLSLHTPSDEDWFRVDTATGGTLVAQAQFASALGTIELEVYDSTGTVLLGRSEPTVDGALLTVPVDGGTEALVRVVGDGNSAVARYRLDVRVDVVRDRFEPNDVLEEAFDLVTGDLLLSGLSIDANFDSDWFRWTSPAAGNFAVDIRFDGTQADLDLELYDADGNFLDASTGTDDGERIRWDVEAGETVLIHAYSFFGLTSNYQLRVNGPGSTPADAREPNDEPDEAAELDGVAGQLTQLSLHQLSDEDWYAWTAPVDGQFAVGAAFSHALANLDLEVYDSQGTIVASSASDTDREDVEFEVQAGQTYRIRIFSADSLVQPNYSLDYQLQIAPDLLEPNDTRPAALDLIAGDHHLAGLSLHEGEDADWFLWKAAASGPLHVELQFDGELGDVDLDLFSGDGRRLATSAGVGGVEAIDWEVAEGESYYIRAHSIAGHTNPYYTLVVDGPGVTGEDGFEPNDSFDSAVQVAPGGANYSDLNLNEGDDSDWFRWSSPAQGNLRVTLDYPQAFGGLELDLFDFERNLLASGGRAGDPLVFPVTAGQTVWVRVQSEGGRPHPRYGLSIEPVFARDAFEPNDAFPTAFNLVHGDQVHQNLTLHDGKDVDWFRWKALADGDLMLQANFNSSLGDLTIELYDSFGSLINVSQANGSVATVPNFFVFEEEELYFKIFSPSKAAQPNYRLTVSGPMDVPADQAENNNSMETAFDLGSRSAMLTELTLQNGDSDWFRWTAPANGHLNVHATFLHALGDVDVALFDAAGKRIALSASTTDEEHLQARVTAGQTYWINVSGADGAKQPRYDLAVTASYPSDRFEPNDQRETGFELYTGDQSHSGLSIERGQDQDWFRWTASASGNLTVTAMFAEELADLNVQLYGGSGRFLTSSVAEDDAARLTWSVVAGETVWIRVASADGTSHPNYRLVIDGPGTLPADVFEPNNSLAAATDLGRASVQLSAMTLHVPGDVDWFRWAAAGTGTLVIDATFSRALGPLVMTAYDELGNRLTQSQSVAGGERLQWAVQEGDEIRLEIASPTGAPIARYDLAATISYPPDFWEPNDTREQAIALVRGPQSVEGNIHTAGDRDWFAWTAVADGSVRLDLDVPSDHPVPFVDVYDERGRLVVSTNQSGALASVTWDAVEATEYRIRVWADANVTLPHYEFHVTDQYLPDAFEANDTFQTASNLQTGDQFQTASLHVDSDVDWYVWTAPSAGVLTVGLDAGASAGHLGLALFNAQQELLKEGLEPAAQQSLQQNVAAGERVWIRVTSGSQEKHPQYRLEIDGPGAIPPDRLEDNGDRASATPVSGSSVRLAGLSIHESGDEDWFVWRAAEAGQATARISLANFLGDLDLEIHDAAGKTIASSSMPVDEETITWTAQQGAEYFLRVVGFQGAVNPDYALEISGPGAPAIPGDFNSDGTVSDADIDQFYERLAVGQPDAAFDLNSDGRIDREDAGYLIEAILGTHWGDTDLDGDVDSADMNRLILSWTGSRQTPGTPLGWRQGDLDGDGDVDVADQTELITHWTGAVVSNLAFEPPGASPPSAAPRSARADALDGSASRPEASAPVDSKAERVRSVDLAFRAWRWSA